MNLFRARVTAAELRSDPKHVLGLGWLERQSTSCRFGVDERARLFLAVLRDVVTKVRDDDAIAAS